MTKYSRVKRQTQTDHGKKELNNIILKKIVLKEIIKFNSFTQGFKDDQKDSISKLNNLQNLLIK